MSRTQYDVLVKNGKERFLVIPEKDFEALQEQLDDEADFRALEASKAKQTNSRRYTLDEVKRQLGLERGKPLIADEEVLRQPGMTGGAAKGKKRAKRAGNN